MFFLLPSHTHTHTHTPIYIYIYIDISSVLQKAFKGVNVTPQVKCIFACLAAYMTSKRSVFSVDLTPFHSHVLSQNFC